jgi:hypothetical protein
MVFHTIPCSKLIKFSNRLSVFTLLGRWIICISTSQHHRENQLDNKARVMAMEIFITEELASIAPCTISLEIWHCKRSISVHAWTSCRGPTAL